MLPDPIEKIYETQDLIPVINELKAKNQKIVFTNGCFDLIHTGHTRYLKAARDAGDRLIVAVNSDESVKGLKGEKRPIVPLMERMEILASFYFVDFVTSFNEPDPYHIIETLKPSILIKGGDWPIEKIIGRDIVERDGGYVATIPVIPGRSTTSIIQQILKYATDEPLSNV